jgi:D-aspartate ligase
VNEPATLPAVVVGGALNALSIVRSLGPRGVPVDVLADARQPLGVRHSRWCRRYVEVQPPLQEAWLDWLLGDDCSPSVLLPAGDEGLELVARHRARLVERGHLPIEANDELVLALLDKARTYEMAAAFDVPAPTAVLLSSEDDLTGLDGAIRYPAFLKAQFSHEYARRFDPGGKGRTVSSTEEVVAAARPMVAEGTGMVLTELVEGPPDAYSSYYTYLDGNGAPLMEATKRKFRQYPIGFGEGTYHQMADEPEAADLGRRFFSAAGLRGIGNVEFKRDARDGQLKIIECNLRVTQADALLRRAGIDLPLLAYARLVGWPVPTFGPQRNGVHLWVPRNDLRALRDYRRSGELAGSAWLRSMSARTVLPLFDRQDLGPSAAEVRRKAGALARRVRSTR